MQTKSCVLADQANQPMRPSREEVLEMLKLELSIVADGGYGSSVRPPRVIPRHFRDSDVCLNFEKKEDPEPCDRCWLMNFVPPEHQKRELPCHHIPLNELGETVASLEVSGQRDCVEKAILEWLHAAIGKLEWERGATQDI